jgi:hypothetical protein
MRMVALVVGIAAALTSTIAAADTLSVADVGSFHVGGRAVSLSGLPTKDVVFTAGSAPIRGLRGRHMLMMDKNSDQIAEMIQKWMADRGLMK